MTLWSEDPTFGPADSPADYRSISSGWALGDTAAAGWWESPTASMGRAAEQYQARHGKPTRAGTYVFQGGAPAMLSAEEANERYGIEGALHWDAPVRSSEAKLLRQWKLEEIARNDRLSRATQGFVPATARFLTGFAVSAIDPINIAASFIPVFGEARWAALAGRIGMRSTRMVRGAAEGFVGSAAVEPIVYFQQRNQQADYTAFDSAMNVAMGTIAGPLLHAGAGLISDAIHARWTSAPISVREDAFAHTASALMEGTPVRAAEIKAQAERAALGSAYDSVLAAPGGPKYDPLVMIEPEDIEAVAISRGGWKGIGDVEVKKGSGFGLVKFIWRHGEKSTKSTGFQVTREDILAFPSIIRRPETQISHGSARRWVVRRPDGQVVLYADTAFPQDDGRRHLVTVHVLADQAELEKELGRPGSPGRDFGVPPRDTAPAPFAQHPAGQSNTNISTDESGNNPRSQEVAESAVEQAGSSRQDLLLQTGSAAAPVAQRSDGGDFTPDLFDTKSLAGQSVYAPQNAATGKATVYQAQNDPVALRLEAERNAPKLDAWLRDLARTLKHVEVYGARAKDAKDINSKLAIGKAPNEIGDYLGGRLIVDDWEALDAVLNAITDRALVLKVDDFIRDGNPRGYRAVHLQVLAGNGTTWELQVFPREINDVYEQTRGSYVKWRRTKNTPGQRRDREADEARSRKLFQKAWMDWLKRVGPKPSQ